MEYYIWDKAYIPKIRAERILDTVEFPSKQFNIPKMSSTDATIDVAQDLIYALYSPPPEIQLVETWKFIQWGIEVISRNIRKSNPPAVTPRVTIRGAYQEKLQQVNQEKIQTKNESQAKQFTNADYLRVPLME